MTYTGTPALGTVAFVDGNSALYAEAVTFSGAATGQRYLALIGGIIYTNSAGANYFPGNVAGAVSGGGVYS